MIASRDLRLQHSPDGPLLTFPDLDLPQGGVLLLSGAATSGKSTWLALAAGLLVSTGGELRVAGDVPAVLPPAERNTWRLRAVGVLPQSAPLNPALTVRGNLALAYFAMGLPEDRWAVTHALAAVQMDSLAKMPARELTLLQTRRVALARALLLAPQVLLLDEPLGGLPVEETTTLLAWVQSWVTAKGSTLVVAARDVAPWQTVFPQAQTMELLLPQQAIA